jgi:hypothetical protein
MLIKMSVFSKVWFWLILIGVILLVVSVILLVSYAKETTPLWVYIIMGISLLCLAVAIILIVIDTVKLSKVSHHLDKAIELEPLKHNVKPLTDLYQEKPKRIENIKRSPAMRRPATSREPRQGDRSDLRKSYDDIKNPKTDPATKFVRDMEKMAKQPRPVSNREIPRRRGSLEMEEYPPLPDVKPSDLPNTKQEENPFLKRSPARSRGSLEMKDYPPLPETRSIKRDLPPLPDVEKAPNPFLKRSPSPASKGSLEMKDYPPLYETSSIKRDLPPLPDVEKAPNPFPKRSPSPISKGSLEMKDYPPLPEPGSSSIKRDLPPLPEESGKVYSPPPRPIRLREKYIPKSSLDNEYPSLPPLVSEPSPTATGASPKIPANYPRSPKDLRKSAPKANVEPVIPRKLTPRRTPSPVAIKQEDVPFIPSGKECKSTADVFERLLPDT